MELLQILRMYPERDEMFLHVSMGVFQSEVSFANSPHASKTRDSETFLALVIAEVVLQEI